MTNSGEGRDEDARWISQGVEEGARVGGRMGIGWKSGRGG